MTCDPEVFGSCKLVVEPAATGLLIAVSVSCDPDVTGSHEIVTCELGLCDSVAVSCDLEVIGSHEIVVCELVAVGSRDSIATGSSAVASLDPVITELHGAVSCELGSCDSVATGVSCSL